MENPDWCYTAEISEGISVNQYFVDHPEMILGKMQMTSGRIGQEATCEPVPGAYLATRAGLAEQLDRAVMRLQRDIVKSRREEKRAEERGVITAQENRCSDEELSTLQTALNEQYDSFVKQYGDVNFRENSSVFSDDNDYNLLCALGNYDT